MTKTMTAESVCAGHPDKLCDLIADSILDAALREDKFSRVACEVMATGRKIIVAGEMTCAKKINVRKVVRDALLRVGYAPNHFLIFVFLGKQSQDISEGVSTSLEKRAGDDSSYSDIGAGDQGTVYGYATCETPEAMPLPLVLAHGICKQVDAVRKYGILKTLLPDGKAQVSVEYEGETPKRVKTIVLSVQHTPDVSEANLREELISKVLEPVFDRFPYDAETEILINPSGRFVIGGPEGDTGLTGRKLMVDTYGGLAAHGGGAFSGKDATKVDRSGAYMARNIAKNIVKSHLAQKCEVAISYAIGKADPVAVEIDTFGTGIVNEAVLCEAVLKVYNLRPAAMIEYLHLRDTNYSATSAYGHFGNSLFSWERLSKATELQAAVEKARADQ